MAVITTADTPAEAMPRHSLRTTKYSNITRGVSLIAAATPISQPWGIRRWRGIRSNTTSVITTTLICANCEFSQTGSLSSASGHNTAATVNGANLSLFMLIDAPLVAASFNPEASRFSSADATRYKHSNTPNDDNITTNAAASSSVIHSGLASGPKINAPKGG